MKRITVLLAVIMLLPGAVAFAADVPLKWDVATGATGYKIQMSTDNGATWPTSRVVTGGTTTSYTWTGAPETGLVMFRVTATNAQGEAIRTDAGCWFNKGWQLPQMAGGLGVN